VEEYLSFAKGLGVALPQTRRDHVAAYVRSLLVRNTPDAKVVGIDAPFGLSNASVQQRLTAIRLFYDFLMEEQQCSANPVGRGRYTPGRVFGGQRDRGLIPRVKKLPWVPSDDDWLALVESVRAGTSRDRFMVALAYDAALRREELCVLATTDIDPAHRVLRVRAETTKNHKERIVHSRFTPERSTSSTLPTGARSVLVEDLCSCRHRIEIAPSRCRSGHGRRQ
jgi:site-specific recombinase XerD